MMRRLAGVRKQVAPRPSVFRSFSPNSRSLSILKPPTPSAANEAELKEKIDETFDFTLPYMIPSAPRMSVPVVHDLGDFGNDLEDSLIGKSLSPVERARLGANALSSTGIRPNALANTSVYILRDHVAAKAFPGLDSVLDPVRQAGAQVTVLDPFQGYKKPRKPPKPTAQTANAESAEASTVDGECTSAAVVTSSPPSPSPDDDASSARLESAVRSVFAQAQATATTALSTRPSSFAAHRPPKSPPGAVLVLAPSLSRAAFESLQASLELEAEMHSDQQPSTTTTSASTATIAPSLSSDMERDEEMEGKRERCLVSALRLGHLPVLNMVSSNGKPIHALAILKTLHDRRGSFDGAKMAFVGSSQRPLPQELVRASAMLGIGLSLSGPKSTLIDQSKLSELVKQAQSRTISERFAVLEVTAGPFQACEGAHTLITDTIIPHVRDDGRNSHPLTKTMEPYELDQDMAEKAAPGFFLMHDSSAAYSSSNAPQPLTDPRCAFNDQMRYEGVMLVDALRWILDQSTVGIEQSKEAKPKSTGQSATTQGR